MVLTCGAGYYSQNRHPQYEMPADAREDALVQMLLDQQFLKCRRGAQQSEFAISE